MPTVRHAGLAVLLLAAACHDGGDPAAPSPPSAAGFRVLGERVVCDACREAVFDLAGPRVHRVLRADFLSLPGTGAPLPIGVVLRRVTGDSGAVLRATVTFTAEVEPGVFALRLHLAAPAGATDEVVLAGALLVTRQARTPGPSAPPASPAPPTGPRMPPPEPPPVPPATPRGTLAVHVEVTGPDAPGGFVIETEGGWSYGDWGVLRTITGRSGEWAVSTGRHWVRLADLPARCSSADLAWRVVDVFEAARSELVLRVTCEAPA